MARVIPLALLGFVAGCGAALAATPEPPLAPAKQTLVVGVAAESMADDWHRAQIAALERHLSRVPRLRLVVADGRDSSAQQVRDIEDMIESKVDILIVVPHDAAAVAPALARARAAQLPVVMLMDPPAGDYTTWIGPDDAAIARDAARHFAAVIKGKGRILMLQGVADKPTTQARTDAFLTELKRTPRLTVAAIKPANDQRADAIRAVEEALRDGVAFDAVYAQSDAMASGARTALIAAGLDPKKIPTVGIGYMAEARAALRRREQSASFTYPLCARETAEVVAKLAAGKRVPRRVVVASRKVTAADAARVEPQF